jgi:hypothetical protein
VGEDVLAPGTLGALSAALSHDIKVGDAELGHIHAMQLHAAVHANTVKDSGGTGMSVADIQTIFSKLGRVAPSRLVALDPSATAPLADRASRLEAAIQASDLSQSGKLLGDLLRDLGRLVEQQMKGKLSSDLASSSDQNFSEYLQASLKLRDLLLAGDVIAAEALAPEVLLQAQRFRNSQSTNSLDSENVYNAYDALGRGALQRNDLDAAQKYLVLAATTTGSSRLESHGPNLSLAKSLLDLGYKEAVVTFLTSCKAWWPNPKLDLWISQIRAGQTPELSPYSRVKF